MVVYFCQPQLMDPRDMRMALPLVQVSQPKSAEVAPLLALKMRGPDTTDGIRALIHQLLRRRSRSEVGTRTAV